MSESASPYLDELQADLIYLLNQYANEPGARLADAIAAQIERILRHPLIDLFPELQRRMAECLNQWRCRAGFEPRLSAASAMAALN
jgi:hypothetical protein